MAAQLQGLLIALLAGACAGPGERRVERATPATTSPAAASAEPAAAVRIAVQEQRAPSGFGPEILLPSPAAEDEEVARVGPLVLRQSHAFARLMTADPKLALSAVDLLVFDVLVARHSRQYGITVEPAKVEQLAIAEEQGMRRQVESELGAEMEFEAYVFRMFGMRLPDWQRMLRLRTAQRLYQGYVIRYLALREDRVRARYLVHRDRAVVQEVVGKVREGADFATLALRLSEDGRRDGGLLPPFGRGFPHPAAEVAFTLSKGQVSEPFERKVRGEPRWFAVYCLDRLTGRDLPFAVVRDELDRDLQQNPLTQVETSAYALLWRGALEEDEAPAANGR